MEGGEALLEHRYLTSRFREVKYLWLESRNSL